MVYMGYLTKSGNQIESSFSKYQKLFGIFDDFERTLEMCLDMALETNAMLILSESPIEEDF